MKDFTKEILEILLEYIDEGIHVIDQDGKTILYNKTMEKLEGMKKQDVLKKQLLDVFPTLNKNSSTLLKVLGTGQKIIDNPQTYFNHHDKEITTINTTIPIFLDDEKVGALEISKNITKLKELSEQIMALQEQLTQPEKQIKIKKRFTFSSIIGENENFKKAIDYAKKASKFSSSVLIYGETGTGKELVAQSIHHESLRASKPFLAQNCAAIPETLLEGMLFGTIKGGFTGAVDRPGLFEQANGGTLFLDELNSMGIQLQSKLLRVLQEGMIRRIGGVKDIPIDVRVIASTNEEPYEAIERGQLRKDLFYRINVIPITLPPLRERKEDIKVLTNYFIQKYNKQLKKEIQGVEESVLDSFQRYRWPGNVRELENVIEGAMNIIEEERILKQDHFSPQANAKIFAFTYPIEYKFKKDLPTTIAEIEKNMIRKVLISCKDNITKASEQLGVKRQTLQHKMKKYNISTK
ncbi:sigma-54 interaction domain-containing protein [Anaerophilus nitritogenes]|uniref:sigma-54 interaction domain-containing protein n=1 Tax=Anaerophilus nitritogenes TaxID=2498136 RepID=UPI00101B66B0|nr:sigma 54-interacting transcriptional regulator [Anaerophilus nitritogenes]